MLKNNSSNGHGLFFFQIFAIWGKEKESQLECRKLYGNNRNVYRLRFTKHELTSMALILLEVKIVQTLYSKLLFLENLLPASQTKDNESNKGCFSNNKMLFGHKY